MVTPALCWRGVRRFGKTMEELDQVSCNRTRERPPLGVECPVPPTGKVTSLHGLPATCDHISEARVPGRLGSEQSGASANANANVTGPRIKGGHAVSAGPAHSEESQPKYGKA
ncbi:hypothetical protein SKAU_G00151390 [Synaphobranchus kaupii]|uniref:Uncharacterized protein n=1 Tax=Synaphobranchus kaupii TaxID=118154 RepID=A0A9Q1FH16_SYNKA|nr:hypothetical protein SKAU_G00151390 [Synaphobranchus kaupii]